MAIRYIFLPGEFLGQRSPVDYSPWDHKELDTIERITLSLYFTQILLLFQILTRNRYPLVLPYIRIKPKVNYLSQKEILNVGKQKRQFVKFENYLISNKSLKLFLIVAFNI